MNLVYVAVPVLKGRSVFTVDKGRAWSAVEHLLLEALARQRWTSADLANSSNLPRRVVVEVLTRLMKAGWVELSQLEGKLLFGSTVRGVAVAKGPELPAVLERISKPISYVIDLVAGGVFRKKHWVLCTENDLLDLYGSRCIRVEVFSPEATLDANEIVSALLDEDETFVNAERSGTTRRYGVVAVRDGAIEGLPPGRDLPELRAAILGAAAAYSPPASSEGSPQRFSPIRSIPPTGAAREFKIKFSTEDLIVDGPAHREHLVSTLRESRRIAIVHSTFISAECFFEVYPEIKSAVERGTRVHILWGQNEELDGLVSTQEAIAKIMAHPDVIRLGEGLTIHPFSTGSHAKFLLADSGSRGGYVAIVGSCNWLTSSFNSFEVSVRLKDPEIVNEVVKVLSSLAPVRGGDWTRFSTELVHLRRKVAETPLRTSANSTASIVLGPNHSGYVLRARDEAKRRALVVSHRFGSVGNPSVVVPLSTAATEHGIAAEVFYARTQLPVNRSAAAVISEGAKEAGVGVRSVRRPRIHAKFLAWDDDFVLVTSLNWLSADPVGGAEDAREMGVWIQCAGIADSLASSFYKAMELNDTPD